MNDFIKNWHDMLAAFEAKQYADAAEKFGGLVQNIAQIVKLFHGLNALEVQAKVEKLQAENHPLLAAPPGEDPKFGMGEVLAIVSVIQSVIAIFGKFFNKK